MQRDLSSLGDMSSPQALFETIVVERKCWEVYLRYFQALDFQKSNELAASCFTEDTEITYAMGNQSQQFNGRAAYLRFLEEASARYEMISHFVGQHIFKWDDATPRLLSHVTSWQWFTNNKDAGEMRPADFVAIGYAEDVFEKVGNHWLIAKRVVRPAAGVCAIGARPS